MADLNIIRGFLTQAQTAVDEAETAVNAEISAKDATIALLTTERDALLAKIGTAKIEADQVVTEAQDARMKLD